VNDDEQVGGLSNYTVTVKVIDPAHPKPSFADLCRANGWGPGTILSGDEGYGPTLIEVTAVGETNVLAVTLSHNGRPHGRHENNWSLSERRNWREVAE
jgi:hypothetical protein